MWCYLSEFRSLRKIIECIFLNPANEQESTTSPTKISPVCFSHIKNITQMPRSSHFKFFCAKYSTEKGTVFRPLRHEQKALIIAVLRWFRSWVIHKSRGSGSLLQSLETCFQGAGAAPHKHVKHRPHRMLITSRTQRSSRRAAGLREVENGWIITKSWRTLFCVIKNWLIFFSPTWSDWARGIRSSAEKSGTLSTNTFTEMQLLLFSNTISVSVIFYLSIRHETLMSLGCISMTADLRSPRNPDWRILPWMMRTKT